VNICQGQEFIEFTNAQQRVISETHGNVFPEAFTLAEQFDKQNNAGELTFGMVEALYGAAFASLHADAVNKTSKWVPPHSLYYLWRLVAQAPKGPICEAGVFRGASATMLQHHTNELHLVDSFEGFDKVCIQDALRSDGKEATCAWGGFEWDVDNVRKILPAAHIHKGWIPDVLNELPDQKWAFVHIDVDLYEPTYHCAQYFLPRMMPGGIIVEDQYVSVIYPGAGRAWGALKVPLLTLPTGQGVHTA
jgi:hypothetical protein